MQTVCIIVPCYNEAKRLPTADFLLFLDGHPEVSLCLVDDGSSDTTLQTLEALRAQRPQQVVVLPVSPNGGKAAAVRAGVLFAAKQETWSILGFWDADLSTPLSEVDRLVAVLVGDPACRLAMGSRVKRLGANIDRRVARHVLGRIFAACATGILGMPVYDSQCGAKLFRRDAVRTLFERPFLTRWLFDIEMLARLRNDVGVEAMHTACEVPLLRWREVGGSKLRLREMIGVPLELLRIRSAYNARR
ncbi:MAG: glycosyltransferase [Vicinamibacterales bacterium]